MIPNRAPSSIWCLSMSDLSIYVRTEVDDTIVIAGEDSINRPASLWLSRKDARLLAKRINECLDATVKR